ncbi:unnamed protein product [Orchesella dallaii]|uniref:Uncharacterized protein n=1 Tax=Orchesella dallaii TaxID=48710 RepID=A0ABP1QMS2_9HEXA
MAEPIDINYVIQLMQTSNNRLSIASKVSELSQMKLEMRQLQKNSDYLTQRVEAMMKHKSVQTKLEKFLCSKLANDKKLEDLKQVAVKLIEEIEIEQNMCCEEKKQLALIFAQLDERINLIRNPTPELSSAAKAEKKNRKRRNKKAKKRQREREAEAKQEVKETPCHSGAEKTENGQLETEVSSLDSKESDVEPLGTQRGGE